jgi:hypothetical protein
MDKRAGAGFLDQKGCLGSGGPRWDLLGKLVKDRFLASKSLERTSTGGLTGPLFSSSSMPYKAVESSAKNDLTKCQFRFQP